MPGTAEVKPVSKELVAQVLEVVPSRAFARPEVHVALLVQDWRVRGLGAFRDTNIETTDSSGQLTAAIWSPRKDLVEYLADLEKDVLSRQGATSVTDFLLTNYVSNMKKIAGISAIFSGMVRQNLQEELPPALGAFIRGYLDQRGQSQTDLAQELNVSQALISNAVNDKPVTAGFLKILQGFDADDEVREAAFDLYAVPKVKEEVDVRRLLHRNRWAEDLYALDREALEGSGFDGTESYLLTRFINTANRLTQITEAADGLPDSISSRDIKPSQARVFSFPSISAVNQQTWVAPILLRVWQSKGLFLPKERGMRYEG
jgi:transcriptional regulator with XRE-family HTH domain